MYSAARAGRAARVRRQARYRSLRAAFWAGMRRVLVAAVCDEVWLCRGAGWLAAVAGSGVPRRMSFCFCRCAGFLHPLPSPLPLCRGGDCSGSGAPRRTLWFAVLWLSAADARGCGQVIWSWWLRGFLYDFRMPSGKNVPFSPSPQPLSQKERGSFAEWSTRPDAFCEGVSVWMGFVVFIAAGSGRGCGAGSVFFSGCCG